MRKLLQLLLTAFVLTPFVDFAADPVRVTVRTRTVNTNAFAPFPDRLQPFRFISDRFGNMIMCGHRISAGEVIDLAARDIVTAKSDPRGRTQWVSVFDGGLFDDFAGVTTDERGNVYVTGITESSSNYYERVTIKYSREGQGIWTNRFDGGQLNFNGGANIASDKQGNVALVFHTLTNDVIAKLSSTGMLEWQQPLPSNESQYSPTYGVRFDSKGRVLLWGPTPHPESGVNQAHVMQFSAEGDLLWENTYSQSPFAHSATALTVDRNDRVIVGMASMGTIISSASLSAAFPPVVTLNPPWTLIAYSAGGMAEWTNVISGVPLHAVPTDIATDAEGSVYVTGANGNFFPGPGPVIFPTVLTAKSSRNGQLRWQQDSSLNANRFSPPRFDQVTPVRVVVLHDAFNFNDTQTGLVWTQTELRFVRRD